MIGSRPLGSNVTHYGPLTINLYDRFRAISDGIVVDEWPVVARR